VSDSPTLLRDRIALFVATSLLVGAVSAVVYKVVHKVRSESGDSVRVVDTRSEVNELLRSRVDQPRSADVMETAVVDDDLPLLVREPITLKEARYFFPQAGQGRWFDQSMYFARPPSRTLTHKWPEHPDGSYEIKTNSFGMREDRDPSIVRPGFRILVTGDSHTDGVCPNADSFPNQLETRLQAMWDKGHVEVLNAGVGGYNFYNYAGVLKNYAWLEPHVFVMAVYGGNDFSGTVNLQRLFLHRPPANFRRPPIHKHFMDESEPGGIAPQELTQVGLFSDNPDDVAQVIETTQQFTTHVTRLAEAIGSRVLFVYIPPPFRGQPHLYEREIEIAIEKTGITPDEIAISDRIADDWMKHARGSGVEVLDLRPAFRETQDPLYWQKDSHINIRAHHLIGELLVEKVMRLFKKEDKKEGKKEED